MIRKFVILIMLSITNILYAGDLPDFPFVVSVGVAEQDVKPDIATITINVLAFNKESSKALETANIASEKIIKLFSKYDIDIKQLEAGNIQKSTKRQKNNNYKQLEILGYEVSRNLTLNLIDLSNYSELTNELVSINNTSGMDTQFDSSNRKQVESELIQIASINAKDKAKKMANSLGNKIHSVYAISQTTDFNDVFGALGTLSLPRALNFEMSSLKMQLFIPDSINISQRINVVFRLK